MAVTKVILIDEITTFLLVRDQFFLRSIFNMPVEFSASDSERIKVRLGLIPDASRRSIGGIVFTRRRRARPTSVIGILLIGRCIIHLRGFSAPGVPEIAKSLVPLLKDYQTFFLHFLHVIFT